MSIRNTETFSVLADTTHGGEHVITVDKGACSPQQVGGRVGGQAQNQKEVSGNPVIPDAKNTR